MLDGVPGVLDGLPGVHDGVCGDKGIERQRGSWRDRETDKP